MKEVLVYFLGVLLHKSWGFFLLFFALAVPETIYAVDPLIYSPKPAVVALRVFTLFPIRHLVFRVPTTCWVHLHQDRGENLWTVSPQDSLILESDATGFRIRHEQNGIPTSNLDTCRKVRLEITSKTPMDKDPGNNHTFHLSIPQRISRSFQGTLEIRWKLGEMEAVLETDPEKLVASVVGAEMNHVQQIEALKAQAVAARSFIASHLGRHHPEGYDFCDTTHCQFNRGTDSTPKAQVATKSTEHLILTYQGRPIAVYYSAVCQNLLFTVPAEAEYPSRRISCPYCSKIRNPKAGMDTPRLRLGDAHGHHFGLCQAGCVEMAICGSRYQEILRHFFPQSHLHQANWPVLLGQALP